MLFIPLSQYSLLNESFSSVALLVTLGSSIKTLYSSLSLESLILSQAFYDIHDVEMFFSSGYLIYSNGLMTSPFNSISLS